jgi:ribosome-binding factor A
MKKEFKIQRLQKELHRVINSIFQGGITDDRLSGLNITRVKLSSDLSVLKIYFAEYNPKFTKEKIIELLTKSSGFIKKQIAGECNMRTIPHINFEHDNNPERIGKIDEIFNILAEEKRNKNYYEDDADNGQYIDEDLEDSDMEDYEDHPNAYDDLEDLEDEIEDEEELI